MTTARQPIVSALTALPLLAVPGAAYGQTAEATALGGGAVYWVGGIAILLLLGGLLVTGHRLRAARTEQADLQRRLTYAEAERAQIRAALDSAPVPRCQLHADGRVEPGPGFSAMLGVADPEGVRDFLDVLVDDDAAKLMAACDSLRRDGQAFSVTVRCRGGNRALDVSGRRTASPEGPPLNLLWLADATGRLRAVASANRETADAERARRALNATLDGLPIPVWRRDADLKLIWANAAFLQAADGDLDTVIGEGREIGARVLGDGGRSLGIRARQSGVAARDTVTVVVGGDRRRLALVEAPLPLRSDAPGKEDPVSAGFFGFALDETPLEDLRAEISRHVAAHADVLENLKSAIAIFGADRRLSFYNQAYVHLWGFEESWLVTKPSLGEVLENLRERRRLPEYADFRAFRNQQMAQFHDLLSAEEELLHLPDGTTLRSLVTPHPFGGLMFIQEDVTSSLTLERNYNTLMAVQTESLDNLAEGIAVFGGDGRLRLFNPAFAEIWQLDQETLTSGPHAAQLVERSQKFFPKDDWKDRSGAMVLAALDRDHRGGRMIRTDGSVIDHATVPLSDGGVLNRYLDVTDSAKIEQALRASNEALEAADRLKTEFMANVSYQLRTPLNAIMGFAEILHNQYFGSLNDRQADYTQSIIDASRRLLALINDILDLASIEAGYLALDLRPVDVGELLSGVFELSREWAGKQHLRVVLDCPKDIGVIEADERRLKQALYNLVSNAIKFTLPGGEIILRGRQDGEQVHLTVADTGVGIPQADQDRIFGRFEKAHSQTRTTGVGLGLALVKSFVEMHGGWVDLKSAPGQGTEITCVLPDHGSEVLNAAMPSPALPESPGLDQPSAESLNRADPAPDLPEDPAAAEPRNRAV